MRSMCWRVESSARRHLLGSFSSHLFRFDAPATNPTALKLANVVRRSSLGTIQVQVDWLERAKGVEPSSLAWEARVMAVIRRPRLAANSSERIRIDRDGLAAVESDRARWDDYVRVA